MCVCVPKSKQSVLYVAGTLFTGHMTSLFLEVELRNGLAIKVWGVEVNIQEPYSPFCDDEWMGTAACFVFCLRDQVIDYPDFSYSLIRKRRCLDNVTFNRVTNVSSYHLCLLYFCKILEDSLSK